MDAAVFARDKSPDIWPFVVGRVVPDDVDQSFVRVARLNLGELLCAAGLDFSPHHMRDAAPCEAGQGDRSRSGSSSGIVTSASAMASRNSDARGARWYARTKRAERGVTVPAVLASRQCSGGPLGLARRGLLAIKLA